MTVLVQLTSSAGLSDLSGLCQCHLMGRIAPRANNPQQTGQRSENISREATSMMYSHQRTPQHAAEQR